MKYMLLIHQGEAPTPREEEAWARVSEDERQAIFSDYRAVSEAPGVRPGVQTEDPDVASTVRVRDRETLVTGGPFVEMKEALGGYLFYRAEDLDQAIALAARIPAARLGGAVEIRPLLES